MCSQVCFKKVMRIAMRVQDIAALEAAINALTGVERTKAESGPAP
jgi:hypothetical protein